MQPFTQKERLLHVKEAQRRLGSKIGWICDTMKNDLKHALGNAPNSEFLIGPDLKVIAKRRWSSPDAIRRDLEKHVGKVDKPTNVADLKIKFLSPPKVAAKGVVKRPKVPGRMRALKLEPVMKDGGQPFYAKLRAEGDSELLRSGKGKLYLGFHLDPIYRVHWNNLTKPIKVTLEPPRGLSLSKTALEGPKVKPASDIDPREFLIDVTGWGRKQPLKLSVVYYACNDDAGWCKIVRQAYVVHLESDRDGGSTRRGGRGGRPGGFTADAMVKRMMQRDRNKDGKLSKAELGRRGTRMFDRGDANKDGFLTKQELKKMFEQFRGRPGGFGPPGGGRRPGGFGPPGGFGGNPAAMVKRILQRDANKDGKLSKAELGQRGAFMLERGDADKDGFLTKDELKKMFERFRGRRGGRPGGRRRLR
ncbi:MAG: EF-hand domain-containing protein [Planctomycetaceae bacterium]